LSTVAFAGDINGDGYDDVIVGGDGTLTGAGRAYVYLGGASGLAASPATTLVGPDPTSRFGASVAGAGDINGDGYADVIVGAPGVQRAYVFLGGAAGLSTT